MASRGVLDRLPLVGRQLQVLRRITTHPPRLGRHDEEDRSIHRTIDSGSLEPGGALRTVASVLDGLLVNVADTGPGDREHNDTNLTIVVLRLQAAAKSLLVIDAGLIADDHIGTMPRCGGVEEHRRQKQDRDQRSGNIHHEHCDRSKTSKADDRRLLHVTFLVNNRANLERRTTSALGRLRLAASIDRSRPNVFSSSSRTSGPAQNPAQKLEEEPAPEKPPPPPEKPPPPEEPPPGVKVDAEL